MLEDFDLNINTIKNIIDYNISIFTHKDIKRNKRSEKEILEIIKKITDTLTKNIENNQYKFTNCYKYINRYVTNLKEENI